MIPRLTMTKQEVADHIHTAINEGEKEKVNHPSHYNALPVVCDECGKPIECITVVREMNFNLGNAVKYIWRAGHKTQDPTEDLLKAIWYLNDEIDRLERKVKE